MAAKILVIDDDPDIRRIASIALQKIGGYRVDLAADADEALDLARREPPDAVLLDVSMPGMDGPATLVALRALPGLALVPVIFCTAISSEHESARLRALGAAGVVPKPFDVAQLPRRIRDILASLAVA
jgi:CheY-like chemotaxis protein